jgi:hypothetical protein
LDYSESAAFETLTAGGKDVSGYMAGTIQHELSHILDDFWAATYGGNPSSSGTYSDDITADIANINGQPCTTFFPSAYCTANAALPTPLMNFQIIQAKGIPTTNREMWAYAFQSKAGGATFTLLTKMETYMTNERSYMNALWTNGHP